MRIVLAAFLIGLAGNACANRTGTDISRELPVMTPRVIDWAEKLAAKSLRNGTALDARLLEIARKSGVRDPHRIRMVVVDEIPLPEEPSLKVAAGSVGLAQSSAAGMTLGYAVLVHRGYQADVRLLSHEFRHVAQYEAAGGIRAFLLVHLPQLVQYGYEDSPYEVDARAHEVHGRGL
jgi:hypothetical protein